MFNRTIKNYQKTKNTKSIKENEIHEDNIKVKISVDTIEKDL